MSEAGRPRAAGPPPQQLRYARLLDWGMKAGLAALIAGFLAYATGVLPALVPFEALPQLWTLPVAEYVRESGIATGWGWLALIGRGDVAVILGVALLAGISLPCLIALVPAYVRAGDWAYAGVTVGLIAVLVLAASGVLVGH